MNKFIRSLQIQKLFQFKNALIAIAFCLSLSACNGCGQGIVNPLQLPQVIPAVYNYNSGLTATAKSTATDAVVNYEFTGYTPPTFSYSVMKLYCSRDGGTSQFVSNLSSSGSQTVYNLNPGSTYVCRVAAVAKDGTLVPSSQSTTFSVYSVFGVQNPQNVELVKAYGVAPTFSPSPISENSPIIAQVVIQWAPFAAFGDSGSVTATSNSTKHYSVYRVNRGDAFNWSSTAVCTTSTLTTCLVNCNFGSASFTAHNSIIQAPRCLDQDVAYPNQYDYLITVTRSGVPEALPGAAVRTTVPIPPANMVLIHRDSVNYEMCRTMYGASATPTSTPDPLNHNRCQYVGPGAAPEALYATTAMNQAKNGNIQNQFTAGYFDFGYHLFMDRFEAGCAWSPTQDTLSQFSSIDSTVADGQVQAASTFPATGDFGFNRPSVSPASLGETFYSIRKRDCMASKSIAGHPTWVSINDPSLNSGDYNRMITNSPHGSRYANGNTYNWRNPPVVGITRDVAQKACNSKIDPTYGPKRLPRRREFNASSVMAWMTDLNEPGAQSYALRQAAINGTLSSGTGSSNGNCNTNATKAGLITGSTPIFNQSNFADGIANPNANGATSAENKSFLYAQNTGLFSTGSAETQKCVSRFGAQDLFGNAAEWVSDELGHLSIEYGQVDHYDCSVNHSDQAYNNPNYSVKNGKVEPSATLTRTPTGSTIDVGANDWDDAISNNKYSFDGVTGPALISDPFGNSDGPYGFKVSQCSASDSVGLFFMNNNADKKFARFQDGNASSIYTSSYASSPYDAIGGTSSCPAIDAGNGYFPDSYNANLFYQTSVYSLIGLLDTTQIPGSSTSGAQSWWGNVALNSDLWVSKYLKFLGLGATSPMLSGITWYPAYNGNYPNFFTFHGAYYTPGYEQFQAYTCPVAATYDPSQFVPNLIHPNYHGLNPLYDNLSKMGYGYRLDNHGTGIGLFVGGNPGSFSFSQNAWGYKSATAFKDNKSQINPVIGMPVQDTTPGGTKISDIYSIIQANTSTTLQSRVFNSEVQYFLTGNKNPVSGGPVASSTTWTCDNGNDYCQNSSTWTPAGSGNQSRILGMTMGGSAHSLGVNRVGGLKHFQNMNHVIIPGNSSSIFQSFTLDTVLNGDYATLILPTDQVPRVYDSFQNTSSEDQNRAIASDGYTPQQFTTHSTTDPTVLDYLDPEASDTGFRCVIPVE